MVGKQMKFAIWLRWGFSLAVLAMAGQLGWFLRAGRPILTHNRVDREVVEARVPAGPVRIGRQENNRRVGQLALQPQEVWLPTFWITRTPITNAQYAVCVEAGVCDLPLRQERNPHYYDPAYADHPVVFVSWYAAETYCEWLGGRLPSEAEWEKAARGADERTYAWGEEDPEWFGTVNINNAHEGTIAVGSKPRNASPYGVLDMGGNVREWVADWYLEDGLEGADATAKVLRGASWFDPGKFAMAFNRLYHVPNSPGQNRGFRCAFD